MKMCYNDIFPNLPLQSELLINLHNVLFLVETRGNDADALIFVPAYIRWNDTSAHGVTHISQHSSAYLRI